MSRVEDIRELEFKQALPLKTIDRAQLAEEYLGNFSAGEDLELAHQELVALYILDETADAGEIYHSFYTSAVLGFYDVEKDEIVIVDSGAEVGEALLAHELTHGLVDQYFPEIFELQFNLTDDNLALSALIEGDAEYVEAEYGRRCEEGLYGECRLYVGGSSGGGSAGVPWGFILIQIFPYWEGINFVAALLEEGGWEAVNRAYERPPSSTEQVIHPEKFSAGEEPLPVGGLGEGYGEWVLLGEDELGEAVIFVMFWNVGLVRLGEKGGSVTYSSKYSEGWGGDWMAVYKKGDRYGYVWKLLWDTEEDAVEFQAGYRTMLSLMEASELSEGLWRVEGGDYVKIFREGSAVTIVNAPSFGELKEIYRAAGIPHAETLGFTSSTAQGIPAAYGKTGGEVVLSLELKNLAPGGLPLTYIVQVKDARGRVVHLNSVAGFLPPGETGVFTASWTPEKPGTYTVQAFVWSSWDDPYPLGEKKELTFMVWN